VLEAALDDAKATSAGTKTLTVSEAVLFTLNVNTVELADDETSETLPLVAEMSLDVNPSTGCENVAVIGIEVALLELALVLESVTVGPPEAARAICAPKTSAMAAPTITNNGRADSDGIRNDLNS
jgi:hypothetical protein